MPPISSPTSAQSLRNAIKVLKRARKTKTNRMRNEVGKRDKKKMNGRRRRKQLENEELNKEK